jgi:two-component SAPR family response regulator
MTKSSSRLSLNFFDKKILDLTFSDMSLSSDGGIILARQVEEKVKICQDMADCLTDNRDQTKVKHSLSQLITPGSPIF